MLNWLGQDVVPGSVVYRGARDGNSSSFKVGVVDSVKNNGTARVHWLYQPSYAWRNIAGQADRVNNVVGEIDSYGNPSVDSLVVMPPETLDRLDQVMYYVKRWKAGDMSSVDLKGTIATLV